MSDKNIEALSEKPILAERCSTSFWVKPLSTNPGLPVIIVAFRDYPSHTRKPSVSYSTSCKVHQLLNLLMDKGKNSTCSFSDQSFPSSSRTTTSVDPVLAATRIWKRSSSSAADPPELTDNQPSSSSLSHGIIVAYVINAAGTITVFNSETYRPGLNRSSAGTWQAFGNRQPDFPGIAYQAGTFALSGISWKPGFGRAAPERPCEPSGDVTFQLQDQDQFP